MLRIRKKYFKFAGHITRKEGLEYLTLMRHIEGRGEREKETMSNLVNKLV